MMRDLNPRFISLRVAVLFTLFEASVIGLLWIAGGRITLQLIASYPPLTISFAVLVLHAILTFTAFPNFFFYERRFVIDLCMSKAARAPTGFYWRFVTHWFRGHGGRLVELPIGMKPYIIGQNRDLRVVIDHGHFCESSVEVAERTFRLYRELEVVKDGTNDEIEAVVRKYHEEGHVLPTVALDWRGTFVDG